MRHDIILLFLEQKKSNEVFIEVLKNIYINTTNKDFEDVKWKDEILSDIKKGLGEELYNELEKKYKL